VRRDAQAWASATALDGEADLSIGKHAAASQYGIRLVVTMG
jgi:hypothetical protein